MSESVKILSQKLDFGNGKVAPNRLVKAPMEEMLGRFGGSAPTPALLKLYRHWAKAGWGMVITGNVAVDRTHLGFPWDISFPSPPHSDALISDFKAYAEASSGRDNSSIDEADRPLVVVQLVHAGRQSLRGSGRAPWKPALAPSAVPMRPSEGMGVVGKALDWLLWGTPRAMTLPEIQEMVNRFAAAAEACSRAGFDGVELHASHGYQLSAFLSPRTNLRTDAYGGDAQRRARILLEIVTEARKRVPRGFLIGVKLNSSDYIQGGLTEDDALLNVRWLAEHGGVDFVEISGGNYENPSFMTEGFDAEEEMRKLQGDTSVSAPQRGTEASQMQKDQGARSARSHAREAFFHNFAKKARDNLPASSSTRLIVTGGLKTRAGMAGAIENTHVDGVGIGRMAAVYPDLPRRVLDQNVVDDEDPRANGPKYVIPGSGLLGYIPIKFVGAGWGTVWHNGMMSYLVLDKKPDVHASTPRILLGIFAPSVLQLRIHAFIAAILVFLVAFLPGVARQKTV